MIEVLTPGLLTTIQDLGRPGWQHLGITPGGAMDTYSALLANALVGNPDDSALLEITLHGPSLCFRAGTWLAITGADLSPQLDGMPLPSWRPVWVPANSRLDFGAPHTGCRAYLAVAGGVAVGAVLGSRSTDLRARFGGRDGEALRKGDCLSAGTSRLVLPAFPQRLHALPWSVAWCRELPQHVPARLRLVPGPDWDDLPGTGRQALSSEGYSVGRASDRMGLRLQGPLLALPTKAAKLSAGVTYGAVQLPPDGQPILLGVDRQTTGGYPLLGTVASVDHPRLAQLRPGESLRFEIITVEQAQALYRRRAERLKRLLVGLRLHWPLNHCTTADSG